MSPSPECLPNSGRSDPAGLLFHADMTCRVTVDLPDRITVTKDVLIAGGLPLADLRQNALIALHKQHDIRATKILYILIKDF